MLYQDHGRPFQLLAQKIEEKAPEFLGIPVDMIRFPTAVYQIQQLNVWPTLCDLKHYKLEIPYPWPKGWTSERLKESDTIHANNTDNENNAPSE